MVILDTERPNTPAVSSCIRVNHNPSNHRQPNGLTYCRTLPYYLKKTGIKQRWMNQKGTNYKSRIKIIYFYFYKLSCKKVLSGRKKYKRTHTHSLRRQQAKHTKLWEFGPTPSLQERTFKALIHECIVKQDLSVFNALTATRYNRNWRVKAWRR